MNNSPSVVKEIFKYNVPVIYRPTKSMLKKPSEPGLSILIENAITEQEVKNLLLKGKSEYKKASTKTIRKWETVAKKRIDEINLKK